MHPLIPIGLSLFGTMGSGMMDKFSKDTGMRRPVVAKKSVYVPKAANKAAMSYGSTASSGYSMVDFNSRPFPDSWRGVDRSVPDSFMRPWKARAIGAPKNFRPRNIGAPKSFQPRNMGRPTERSNVGFGSQGNSGRKKIIAKTFYERDA